MEHEPQPYEIRERPPDEAKKSRWGFRGMTVREWLELLIVPVVLSLITVVFTWQQNERQQDLETKRANHAQKIENQRAEAERAIQQQNAQDEALKAYLDQMSTLLLERDLRISTGDNATEDSKEARILARARTITVLGKLDPSRRTAVLNFLVEANLAQRDEVGKRPIIALSGANLSGANLDVVDLLDADLTEADLPEAGLLKADMSEAYLRFADLTVSGLIDADLSGASLPDVLLDGADLNRANLSGAALSE